MAICEKCKYENACEMPAFIRNGVSKCRVFEERKQQKQQTNADRIRSMTDEDIVMQITVNVAVVVRKHY